MDYSLKLGVLATQPYADWLVSGTLTTLFLGVAAWLIAVPLGTLVGMASLEERRWLRGGARIFVELFRNVPLLAQLFLWYFVLPEILPAEWGLWLKRGLPWPELWTSVVCLGFYTAARIAEQVRAGIGAVGVGKANAAAALGLRRMQTYRYILLPLCFRTILAPLTSEFVTVFKNSALASALGLLELTQQARQIENYTFRGFEAFGAATVIYFVISLAAVGTMATVGLAFRRPRAAR